MRSYDVMVKALDLRLKGRGFYSRPFCFQIANNLRHVVHTCLCHQKVQIGTGQTAVMPDGWEGNRRSDVGLAIRNIAYVSGLFAYWLKA